MNRNKIPMKSHQPTNHRYNNQSPKYRDPAQGKYQNNVESVVNNYHNDGI